MKDTQTKNTQVFLDYVAACTAKDLETALGFFTAESVYQNMPMEPVHGIEGVRSVLEPFFRMVSATRFEIHSIAATDTGIVLTERTDSFCINGLWRAVRVMGAVNVKDRKIMEWREYYDSRQMEAAFA